MPGMEMLGPTTKPPRRFRIFHRTRGKEENEGGGLGRNAIFAGQPRPDVMMRVGTGHGRGTDRAFFNKGKGGVRPSSSYSKTAKHPSDTVVHYPPLLQYSYLYRRSTIG